MEKWEDERYLVMVGRDRDVEKGWLRREESLKKKDNDSWRRRLWSLGMP